MVKISNIKVLVFNLLDELKNKKNADLQKCAALFDEIPKNLIPKKDKITVYFELKETNADMANAIRRCLINELEILSLSFNEYDDMDTTDAYILSDFIKKNIELLPINQELEEKYDIKELTLELELENKTDEIIDITSSDFTAYYKDKKIDITEIVNENIVISRLHPGDNILIKNIFIEKGVGKTDAGKFSAFSNTTYKIIDVIPLDEETGDGQSSMVSNPAHFAISYTTHRNIKHPKKMMIKCCDTLIRRLENILTDLQNINNKSDYYYSDLLQLETNGNIKKLLIKGEQWTLINLISRYCFILTKGNIKFVAPALIHPEKDMGVINITHPEFSKLINDAIKKIINELNDIKKAF